MPEGEVVKKTGIFLLFVMCALATGFAQGTTKLVLWDQFYRDVESSIMEQTIAKFHDENPTIVIDRTTKTLDDLKLVLKMAVESGTGPDIMQVNQGEADMGVFVKAGLLVDLTATAKVKKWNSIFSDSALKLMGYKGKTYGVSSTAEIVGFFYNKGIFEKLGLKIPQTFSELQATLDKVKKAGYTPINFGNLDGWTGIHEWSGIQHVLTTRNELDDMMSGTKGTFWMASANIKAAETLQAWVKAGYFSKNFAAIGYDDSAASFMRGDSALMFTGNWLQGEFSKIENFKVGFFLMPTDKAANLKAIGAPGIPFCVSSKSKNVDAAIKFLDFLSRKDIAKLWASELMLPAVGINESDVTGSDDLFKDIVKAYKKAVDGDAIGYYIDWVTPTFYDTTSAAVQKLMALEMTPQDFVKSLDADYAKFIGSAK